VVADLSFISLTLVLPALAGCAAPDADFVLLVKPQFEVGKGRVGAGGVVRIRSCGPRQSAPSPRPPRKLGLGVRGVTASPLPGPAGNVEYFLWLRRGAPPLDEAVARAIAAGAAVIRVDQRAGRGPASDRGEQCELPVNSGGRRAAGRAYRPPGGAAQRPVVVDRLTAAGLAVRVLSRGRGAGLRVRRT
jgi:hypothetical protein